MRRATTKAAVKVNDAYNEVLKYKRIEWTLAAFYRKGYALERFGQTIIETPVPPEVTRLGENAVVLYQDALAQQTAALEDKAVEAYAATLTEARKNRISNEWTKKTLESLNRLAPGVPCPQGGQGATIDVEYPDGLVSTLRGSAQGRQGDRRRRGMTRPPGPAWRSLACLPRRSARTRPRWRSSGHHPGRPRRSARRTAADRGRGQPPAWQLPAAPRGGAGPPSEAAPPPPVSLATEFRSCAPSFQRAVEAWRGGDPWAREAAEGGGGEGRADYAGPTWASWRSGWGGWTSEGLQGPSLAGPGRRLEATALCCSRAPPAVRMEALLQVIAEHPDNSALARW